MFNIGNFLKRIQNVRTKDVYVKEVVAEAVKKVTGSTIKPEDIAISAGTVTLKGLNAALRSEIFIKKQTLLAEINTKQDLKKVVDVR